MALLEELKPGVLVIGLLPGNLVTVIDVKHHGSIIELIYEDANGQLGKELILRDREADLEIASEGLPWSFDADGATFRLTSEAYRINLAYLFDPLIAVHTSLIEPLPHQITAVYETMLGKQPLRYLLADDPGAGKTIMTGLLIKELMIRGDLRRCLIVSVPIEAASVQFELTHSMEDHWQPVIEKDVVGPHALPLQLDRENGNLGRYSACRRVSRTIFLGSAPTLRTTNKGLTDSQIKLGCVQPGESVATFGDALRRLTDHATHLYQNDKRYWYSTQPSVARLAQDRADQYDDDRVFEEIELRLKAERQNHGDFSMVHVSPNSGAEVADDEQSARLVILKSPFTHALRDQNSPARQETAKIMDFRANTRRNYRNTLVFVAPDRTRMEELKQAARQFLAWKSIDEESICCHTLLRRSFRFYLRVRE